MPTRWCQPIAALALVLGAALAVGCATPSPAPARFDFFAAPDVDDTWYEKILEWQARERAQRSAEALEARSTVGRGVDEAFRRRFPSAGRSGLLRVKLGAFETRWKRSLAVEFTEWTQEQALLHYRNDPVTDLEGDHWPTLTELLDTNGDDCDGLDLISYNLMRQFGFREGELYRGVVRRARDGANHMVTLWFESRDDPWVIDATGAVSIKMRRFSQLPGWVPIWVFSETEVFRVVDRATSPYDMARDEPE